MNRLKVIKVTENNIEFENNIKLSSYHDQECCEEHYLSFSDITIEDFKDLEFDLTTEKFFNRIEDYGIELIPIKGHSIKIPGYAYNNGYYSSNLSLELTNNKDFNKSFNIDNCQSF